MKWNNSVAINLWHKFYLVAHNHKGKIKAGKRKQKDQIADKRKVLG